MTMIDLFQTTAAIGVLVLLMTGLYSLKQELKTHIRAE